MKVVFACLCVVVVGYGYGYGNCGSFGGGDDGGSNINRGGIDIR
jgi:hypothetical protein